MSEDIMKFFTEGKKLMLLLKGIILNLNKQVQLCILFLNQQLFIFKNYFL